ncbi:TIGR03084 family metal-binding protein [Alphaproteobacteria bacterium]|nr:TIGR03084 family metal-binding protein [Alphaproteobacteria bacterium]
MFTQPQDFQEQNQDLYDLIKDLDNNGLEKETRFKSWTLNRILGHLHMWNWAAAQSLEGEDVFANFANDFLAELKTGSMATYEAKWLDGLQGTGLLKTWWNFSQGLVESYSAADPKARVKWMGPNMSVRSSVTARIMETWSHGQAVFDLMGEERQDRDSIKNIAVLGLNTFGWTYVNRKLTVPDQRPSVHLIAPSGENWDWPNPESNNAIKGSATEFCQVVTQTRNVADTSLDVIGPVAQEWMATAQCFAGPVETPPVPGGRRKG